MPAGLRSHGLLLVQTGAPRRLIPHMLAGASLEGITEHSLRCMLTMLGAPVVKRKNEKSVTKFTLLWSLILAACKNMSADEQTNIFLNFCSPEAKEKQLLSDALAQEALNTLPFEEVRTDYAGMKERLERNQVAERYKQTLSREKGEHARKQFETPEAIKQLKPDGPKIVLCMDRTNKAWEAYYPGGTPTKSISVSWSAPGRTMLSALTFATEYLWKNHANKGRDPGLQTWTVLQG